MQSGVEDEDMAWLYKEYEIFNASSMGVLANRKCTSLLTAGNGSM
jgi:hypothetical protein